MRTSPPDLLPIFRSNLQAQLLAALFLQPEEPATAVDLAEHTGGPTTSVYRELKRLAQAGLVERGKFGYQAAKGSPVYEPLHALLERTLGVEALLSKRLSDVDGIEDAAIFGSWAEGNATEGSDVDLLVVGDVERDELLAAVRSVEAVTAREIDVTVYRREEFDRRREEGSGFLRTVLRGPLIQLIGEVS